MRPNLWNPTTSIRGIPELPAAHGKTDQVGLLLATQDLAGVLDSGQFRRFLDQMPVAIVVAEMKGIERIVYANPAFERLSGQAQYTLLGRSWSILEGRDDRAGSTHGLGAAIAASNEFVGTFRLDRDGQPALVHAYSNIIEDDDGTPCYRLAALVEAGAHGREEREALELRLREKDTLLFEIQHRIKNNLQMITALIRLEAKNAKGRLESAPFDRLAGRIQSIHHLYALLSHQGREDEIELGAYLSKIASSVLSSYPIAGIRLDLKLDAFPVSVNVALPIGLVVNEVLTNALKHAFIGRDSGTIILHGLVDGGGCRIVIADDGVGLPNGVEWPERGKLSALIVQSLRQNANARVDVESRANRGTCVTIAFIRSAMAPEEAS
jgi:PAS domain S-box-containing protein